ncbi:XRE family transcriptional regulator [Streptomyces durbertensis]|uniref:XRE family transcriptional regulator n=1 Tax=Streptomyces durbertensis TaxID=2448886 RepID=A0ABR6EC55_9ACTN|nr:XRE family transcriptional regulator [Streptomyces durbertensis]MBB1242672.1 XRE family transcriptional regulator [Streptomyces durbertensis]
MTVPATRVGPHVLFNEEEDDPLRRRELLAALAAATTGTVLGSPAAARAAEPTPSAVAAAVRASRADFSACRYDALSRALSARIALAESLGSQGRPEQAATAVAKLYSIATRLCIKLGEDGLAPVTADRALSAALGGADAVTVAEAHRMVSSTWRRRGRYDRAVDIAVAAAQELGGGRNVDVAERLSVQGDLYATAAYTAAKQGDRDTAQGLIAEAAAIAGRLDHGGPSQVVLHQVSVSYLLGDAGEAIEHARRVDPAGLPSAERRARYWIDVARAFSQWGKPDRCYRALLAAERAAPEEVRRGSVRVMAGGLMRHDRTLPGVRAFAHRVGALG